MGKRNVIPEEFPLLYLNRTIREHECRHKHVSVARCKALDERVERAMKLVILDGCACNPGDLDWAPLLKGTPFCFSTGTKRHFPSTLVYFFRLALEPFYYRCSLSDSAGTKARRAKTGMNLDTVILANG